MSMVFHEQSIYKATYKQYAPGTTITPYALEIVVYGETQEVIEERLNDTIYNMNVGNNNFKLIKIERK